MKNAKLVRYLMALLYYIELLVRKAVLIIIYTLVLWFASQLIGIDPESSAPYPFNMTLISFLIIVTMVVFSYEFWKIGK